MVCRRKWRSVTGAAAAAASGRRVVSARGASAAGRQRLVHTGEEAMGRGAPAWAPTVTVSGMVRAVARCLLVPISWVSGDGGGGAADRSPISTCFRLRGAAWLVDVSCTVGHSRKGHNGGVALARLRRTDAARGLLLLVASTPPGAWSMQRVGMTVGSSDTYCCFCICGRTAHVGLHASRLKARAPLSPRC